MSVEFRASDNIIMISEQNNNNNNQETYISPIDISKYDSCISLESLSSGEAYVSKCGHSFGLEVIDAVKNKTIKNCPLCREKLVNNMPRNYLLEDAVKDIDILDGECRKNHYEIIDLKEQVFDLQEQNSTLRNEIQTTRQVIVNNTNVMLRLEGLLLETREQRDRAEEKSDRYVDKFDKKKREYKELKIDHDNAQKELNECRSENEHLKDENLKYEKTRADLQKQLDEKPTIVTRYYSSDSSDSDTDTSDSDSDTDDSYKKRSHQKNSNTQQIVKQNVNPIIAFIRDCPINVILNKVFTKRG